MSWKQKKENSFQNSYLTSTQMTLHTFENSLFVVFAFLVFFIKLLV